MYACVSLSALFIINRDCCFRPKKKKKSEFLFFKFGTRDLLFLIQHTYRTTSCTSREARVKSLTAAPCHSRSHPLPLEGRAGTSYNEEENWNWFPSWLEHKKDGLQHVRHSWEDQLNSVKVAFVDPKKERQKSVTVLTLCGLTSSNFPQDFYKWQKALLINVLDQPSGRVIAIVLHGELH